METPTIPVGHKTLQLKDLSPKKSAAFSPNLYRWMRARSHFYDDGGTADGVYRVKPGSRYAETFGSGTLVIGHPYSAYEGDTDFSGARLLGVLCNGSEERRYCLPGAITSLELVAHFWDRYLEVGRCAIDPAHQEHFQVGERYREHDGHRTCLWCGAEQIKVMTPRTVVDVSWVPV